MFLSKSPQSYSKRKLVRYGMDESVLNDLVQGLAEFDAAKQRAQSYAQSALAGSQNTPSSAARATKRQPCCTGAPRNVFIGGCPAGKPTDASCSAISDRTKFW